MGNIFNKVTWRAKESYFPDSHTKIGEYNLLQFGCKDKLVLIDDDKFKDRDMFVMKHSKSKKVGLVSKAKVGRVGTIDFEPWYFGAISRREAEQNLADKRNGDGSFLLRDSSKGGKFAMSLKFFEDDVWVYKHHLIQFMDGEYFFKEHCSHKYPSLKILVEAYQSGSQGMLIRKLRAVCLRPEKDIVSDSSDPWDIPERELEVGITLGSGKFGIVSKGIFRGVHAVAIKSLRGESALAVANEFFNETNILKSLDHPNLVQVIGVCEARQWIVLEFLEGGDLLSYLENQRAEPEIEKLIGISEDISCGMRELERIGIVHRDLAARNVLIDKFQRAKVSDFGLAREGDEYRARQSQMPLKWSAPESLKFRQFSFKSDVWSFGIVLWEIFSLGETLYAGIENVVAYLEQNKRLDPPQVFEKTQPKVNEAMYQIMIACWNKEPLDRPSISQIYSSLLNFDPDDIKKNYDDFNKYLERPKDERSKLIDQRTRVKQSSRR